MTNNQKIQKSTFSAIASLLRICARLDSVIKRHWDIIDADGQCDVIDGYGVIGQQPRIAVDERFSYSSFAR